MKRNDSSDDVIFEDISVLIGRSEWDLILIKLDSLKFMVPICYKKLILKSDAPDWLKNAVFLCKVIPSA